MYISWLLARIRKLPKQLNLKRYILMSNLVVRVIFNFILSDSYVFKCATYFSDSRIVKNVCKIKRSVLPC